MKITREDLENYKNTSEQLDELNAVLSSKKKQFEEDNQEMIKQINNLNEVLDANKDILKVCAEAEYRTTGEKKLLGGIGIRVGISLIYDDGNALKWAMEHSLALSLDKKRFEQLAKTENIDFVEKLEKITVTFPKEIEVKK
ncbi:MAG: hypothetical protein KKB59_19430 [Spirochaetes bacterium]|nr:hypothetical protein [Spirochaetota bacterium]